MNLSRKHTQVNNYCLHLLLMIPGHLIHDKTIKKVTEAKSSAKSKPFSYFSSMYSKNNNLLLKYLILFGYLIMDEGMNHCVGSVPPKKLRAITLLISSPPR